MKIGLDIEITFATDEGSDIFVFVKNSEHLDEVGYEGLTLEDILRKTFEEITNEEERREIVSKIRLATVQFLAKLDDIGKEENKNS